MSQILLKTEIRDETDVVAVRKKAREISESLRFDIQDQTRIATAVSEIARNAYEYAKGGMVEFKVINEAHTKFVVVIKDQGPGISKLDDVLGGIYQSPHGMGLGIMGAQKLMDGVEIQSSPNGTTVTLKKIIPNRKGLLTPAELKVVTDRLVSARNSPMEELQHQNQEILLAVTALNEKKEELQLINQELEDTNRGVLALYAELDEKAEILRMANESKTSFLSDMTHEFRSPLNSILSITQILLGDAKKENATEREKQINFVVKAARGLSEMVNDLLDIAKIEAGKIRIRPGAFSVNETFSTLRGLMRPIIDNEKVELQFEEPEDINLTTDEAKLNQILRNLISNAIKYTEQGEVLVKAHKLDNGNVCFSVKDSGIGIAPNHLAGIFEEFYQVDNIQQSKNKGSGLGLPLSTKLAKLLGGKLTVKSTIGKGSTFFLEIPMNYLGPVVGDYTLPASKLSHVIPQNLSQGKRKILVVDDDEGIRYSIKTMLQEFNVDIREATNGEEGWQVARTYLPDLVILDMVMPHKDGMGFIEECMSQHSTRAIPILLHTSKILEPEEVEYLAQVTSGVIVKGESGFGNLKEAVKNFLGNQEK